MNPTFLPFFIIGLWIGGIINAIWYYWWAYISARRGKPLGKYKWPILSIFEHYHHSTALFIASFRLWRLIYPVSPVLAGVATVFLLDEVLAQQHKLALGSGHFMESLLLEIIIFLIWILVELVAGVFL